MIDLNTMEVPSVLLQEQPAASYIFHISRSGTCYDKNAMKVKTEKFKTSLL